MDVFPSVIYSLSILLLGANAIQSENLAGKCDEQGQRNPLKVQIKAEESGEICDGSILSLNHILTKASCVYKQSVDQIFMLDHPEVFDEQNELNLSTFRKISIFPSFSAQNSSNNQEDFAILTLTKPLLEKPESQILSVMSWMKEVLAEELPELEDQSKESEDLAIMITGGDTETRWVTVELLRSDGSFWCSLPDLPGPRVYHTQNGLVTCGGRMSLSPGPSCVTFTSGEWFKSHSLIKDRTDHFSWISPQGILLMGEYEDDSTELLTPDGLSKLNFTMKLPNYDSCPIQLKDKVIVTGGGLYYTARKVIAYNLDGWLEDLPDLIDYRFGHGCGHFTNTDGLLVKLNIRCIWLLVVNLMIT